jgi:hypothetical protein
MAVLPDLVIERGQKFGKLEFHERVGRDKASVVCECGTEKMVLLHNLVRGNSKSCGCAQVNPGTHGETSGGPSPEYRVWGQMKDRCSNRKNKYYNDYGGRGIYVCAEWRDDFTSFLRDMGRRPSPRHRLERKDNDGPYRKDNCVWATEVEQGRNKRNNVLLTFRGETLCLSAWAEKLGLRYNTLLMRLRRGWSTERVLGHAIGDDRWHHPTEGAVHHAAGP